MILVLAILGGLLLVYSLGLAVLFATGRRSDAASWARLIPDCLVFVARLVSDDRVGKRYKVMLVALIGYLAMPFDLVPDFIPVVGLLDDVIVVFLVLRAVLRGIPRDVVTDRWPGGSQELGKLLSMTRR